MANWTIDAGSWWSLGKPLPDYTYQDAGKVLTVGSGPYYSPEWQSVVTTAQTDGTNYWIEINGIRLYFASSEPSGNIPNGSLGIGW